MDMERIPLHDLTLQRTFDAQQMSDWVNWLAEWQVIAHLTFSWECSMDSGRRVYERFMKRHLGRVSYFYALEQNPARDGFHVHALWADAGTVFRKEAWSAWFTRYGRARIEPVRYQQDVSGYCAKYVCKERAWWDVKLQWHRRFLASGQPFRLGTGDPVPVSDSLLVPAPAAQLDSPSCRSVSQAWVKYGGSSG
jgi:hypothetical protein